MAVSLRRTLAFRFFLTMGAALFGIGLWAFADVRRTLGDQLEQSLRSSLTLQTLDLAEHGRITEVPGPPGPGMLVRAIDRLVVVRDSSGAILQANSPLARELPLDRQALGRARGGEPTFVTGAWHGGQIRSLAAPVPPGAPRGAAVLQVATATAPLEQASRRLLGGILAIAALGALATLVGAWWLAGSALAPVDEIAAQAGAIQGLTGGGRITAHAEVEELQGLIRVLNEMLGRLDRAAEWHRRIIRDLGHDLRTPITTIRASVEVGLIGSRDAAEYRRILASALEETDRLALIADALSLLGRLESGALAPERHPTDLRTVVREALARAAERTATLTPRFAPPADPVIATVDARLLGTALDQLLDNGARHTAPGTPVEVGVAAGDGVVVLTVEDEGPGVPEAVLPRLFERFYRADAARGREGGAGLGLTVVATIVDLHQGRVTAERGRTGGLRVRIELPV